MLRRIIKMFKSIFFVIISIFKRALCCFRRRKRTTDFVPLTQVGVISDQGAIPTEVESWSNWNEPVLNQNSKPNSVQEHIEYYRQQAIAARQVKSPEPEEVQESFFDDMTPTITRQTKLFVSEDMKENDSFNKLSLAPENVNIMGRELEEWEDNTGWEDESLDIDAREALRETRKQARQKKIFEQQQRRQEKFIRPALGAKLYS